MEKKSYNALASKPISLVAEEAKTFIRARKEGTEKSLKVASSKLNSSLMGGFDWNRIVTLAGLSGSGKSTLLRQWIRELIELNSDQKFDVLTFQFEMLGVDEIAKDVSSKVNKSVKEIYSAEKAINEDLFNKISKELDALKEYPIYVVDRAGTVKEIVDTIIHHVNSRQLRQNDTGIVVTLDHSLLCRPEKNEDEKVVIDHLMHSLIAVKKLLVDAGVKCLFFVLSQLNRNIESVERISNPKLHYPNKTDIFAASSVYYSSDYVLIIHRPCLIEGLGNWYGPPDAKRGRPQGLPVFNPDNSEQSMIYLHIIKERFGVNRILAMVDELEFSRIREYKKL